MRGNLHRILLNGHRPDATSRGHKRLLNYYATTADEYEDMHVSEDDEHAFALHHIAFYLRWIGAKSILDTGCGTGRTMDFIRRAAPGVIVRGNDPSHHLLKAGLERQRIGISEIVCSSSERLPYKSGSFDAVIATGVLHHVPNPGAVVQEMLRVASKAVFISDSNVYGRGSRIARAFKLSFSLLGLHRPLMWAKRGGKHWFYSEGDGIAYSYSVFDSYRVAARACAQMIIIPTQVRANAGLMPILQSSHGLLCGFKHFLSDATEEMSDYGAAEEAVVLRDARNGGV